MNVLYLDIETSPNVAYVWGLFKQNVSISQLISPTRVICAAYSWGDSEDYTFVSEWGGKAKMFKDLYAALNEADVVVHYNGASFDVPHLNREFLERGWAPPSPYAQVDLYRAIRGKFRFPSNKLAYVSDVLELGDEGKLHTDMSLWTRVLNKDDIARAEMERYNIEDVVLLKDLYEKLKPWISSPPNAGLYVDSDRDLCISCGSDLTERRGFAYTSAGKFQRYQCQECGRWMRSNARVDTTPLRAVR